LYYNLQVFGEVVVLTIECRTTDKKIVLVRSGTHSSDKMFLVAFSFKFPERDCAN